MFPRNPLASVITLVTCAVPFTANQVVAATFDWVGGFGNFEDTFEWSPIGNPGEDDHALFNQAGTYTVTFDSTTLGDWESNLGYLPGSFATVTNTSLDVRNGTVTLEGTGTSGAYQLDSWFRIRGGATLNLSGTMLLTPGTTTSFIELGDALGHGTLNINAGAFVNYTGATVRLGKEGSNGTVSVSGIGARIDAGEMYIGNLGTGTGTLNIYSDAGVNSDGILKIGNTSSSTGFVNVNGAKAEWNITSTDARIGNIGDGTVTISNGKINAGTTSFDIAHHSLSTGTLNVYTDDGFTTSGEVNVGNGGLGTVNTFSNNNGINTGTVNIANLVGSIGNVNFNDGDWIVGPAGDFNVGGNSTSAGGTGTVNLNSSRDVLDLMDGTLRIWGGGTINQNDGSIRVKHYDHTNGGTHVFDGGTLEVRNGSWQSNSGMGPDGPGNPRLYLNNSTAQVSAIVAGSWNSGTLDILNGSTVSATLGISVGGQPGGTGSMTVGGAGSTLTTTGETNVGFNGEGSLTIDNNGTVFTGAKAHIGRASAAIGTVDVSGGGSWSLGRDLYVGYSGNGTLNISAGGTVFAEPGADSPWNIGYGVNSAGTVNITGAGAHLSGHNQLHIGFDGQGTLNIDNGGTVDDGEIFIGSNSAGLGEVNLSGSGSSMTVANDLYVGYWSQGTLNVNDGAAVTATNIRVVDKINGSGTVNVTGFGASLSTSNDLVVGRTGFGTSADVNINFGGTVNVGNDLVIDLAGRVDLQGGTLNVTNQIIDSEDGIFNFSYGTLNWDSDYDTNGSALNGGMVLSTADALNISGTTTIADPAHLVSINQGATFSSGALVNYGQFIFNDGTFNLTNSDLTLGAGGLFGTARSIEFGQNLNVTQTLHIDPGAVLQMNGGNVQANVVNNGRVLLSSPLSTLSGTMVNNGRIDGDGTVAAVLTNGNSGEIRAQGGDTVTFTNAGNTNSGEIRMFGGTVEFTQDLVNQAGGTIEGQGNLIVDGGLDNLGELSFSSLTTNVVGNVVNGDNTAPGTIGSIRISGNSVVTFYGDMDNEGSVFRVGAGSTAVFLGDYSGSTGFTGGGLKLFEGSVSIGSSPAAVNYDGDVEFGAGSLLLMELGGADAGTGYDQLTVEGTTHLDGILEVSLIDDFKVKDGDSFDLFASGGGITGGFDAIILPELAGYQFDMEWTTSAISLTASAVPLPAGVWLLLSGLGVLGVRARRHKSM